ncbi:MAG: hypothetical protein Q9226_006396 [Calogaya cf. arnoldii]
MEASSTQTLRITAAALGLTTLVVFVYKFWTCPREASRAPPIIQQVFPFVGHFLGLLTHGFEFFEHLAAKCRYPIFTLQILGKDVHVVTSPDLVIAIQKNPRIYDFSVFARTMLPRLFDLDRKAMQLASTNLKHTGGSWDLVVDTSRIFHRCLSPGPSLEQMERAALAPILGYLEGLASEPNGVVLYGPRNPFNKRLELEQAFWDWEHDLTRLLLTPAPSLFARKGYRARALLIDAMTDYLEWKGHSNASDLTKARYRAGITYGLSIPSIARFELGSIMGLLVNSTPTLFWLLIHIYSDPQLLASLRDELSTESMKRTSTPNGAVHCTIDVPTLRQTAPLLLSAYQETLRFHTHNTSSRLVTQDTILSKRHHLKAGSIIQIPSATMHSLPSIWGADAYQFNPRRFLASTSGFDKNKSKTHPGAFRSFGGGVSLCPGRHFAATEVCAAAAMFVSRFDRVVVDAKGEAVDGQVPAMGISRITSSVPLPRGDIRVKVSARKDSREWTRGFGFGEELLD